MTPQVQAPGLTSMLFPLLILGACIAIGFFFRKSMGSTQNDAGPDDLIRRGNQLIIAAREGRIGFSDAHIQTLQASYLHKTNWWENWKLRTVVFAVGVFVFMAGFALWYEPDSSDGHGAGSKMLFGSVICAGSFVYNSILRKTRDDGRKYVVLVESEYPKLEKKEAA